MVGSEIVVAGVIAGAGGCFGILGGLAGRNVFTRLAKSLPDQVLKTYGFGERSLLIGLLASGGLLVPYALGDEVHLAPSIGFACLPVSFVSAFVYVLGWLRLVRTFGPEPVGAGELSLAATIILTAGLHVCGILWITLVALGGCALVALTVLNGHWIYRLR